MNVGVLLGAGRRTTTTILLLYSRRLLSYSPLEVDQVVHGSLFSSTPPFFIVL